MKEQVPAPQAARKVLVTGANGMLAANLIERLIYEGYEVVATLRKGRTYPGELSPSLKLVEADFKDVDQMRGLMDGVWGVMHVAAMTSQSCHEYAKYREVNVEATKRLVELAIGAGVQRFLYVSTANTIGFGGDETAPMCYPFADANYAKSKKEAEDTIRPYADRIGLVIVNPTFMIGKYGGVKGSNSVIELVRKSYVLTCPFGGKNVLNVTEAARGIVMAMEKGKSGENYLITGKNYTYKELFSTIAEHLGVKRKYIAVPDWVLSAGGGLGNLLGALGMDVEFGSVNMDMLKIKNFYFTDKAYRDFGFRSGELF